MSIYQHTYKIAKIFIMLCAAYIIRIFIIWYFELDMNEISQYLFACFPIAVIQQYFDDICKFIQNLFKMLSEHGKQTMGPADTGLNEEHITKANKKPIVKANKEPNNLIMKSERQDSSMTTSSGNTNTPTTPWNPMAPVDVNREHTWRVVNTPSGSRWLNLNTRQIELRPGVMTEIIRGQVYSTVGRSNLAPVDRNAIIGYRVTDLASGESRTVAVARGLRIVEYGEETTVIDHGAEGTGLIIPLQANTPVVRRVRSRSTMLNLFYGGQLAPSQPVATPSQPVPVPSQSVATSSSSTGVPSQEMEISSPSVSASSSLTGAPSQEMEISSPSVSASSSSTEVPSQTTEVPSPSIPDSNSSEVLQGVRTFVGYNPIVDTTGEKWEEPIGYRHINSRPLGAAVTDKGVENLSKDEADWGINNNYRWIGFNPDRINKEECAQLANLLEYQRIVGEKVYIRTVQDDTVQDYSVVLHYDAADFFEDFIAFHNIQPPLGHAFILNSRGLRDLLRSYAES